MSEKATVRDVRRVNRALLVRHLMIEGQTSRRSAGQATDLSPATVTNVVAELIDDGIVGEEGSIESEGGRPRTLLGLNRDAAHLFGADVGESTITVGLFDLRLSALAERVYPFTGRRISADEVASTIAEGVADILRDADPSIPILGLGLGVPGIVQSVPSPEGEDIIVHAQVIGWESVSFADLSDRLGMPVLIDNGAKTTTQAESWFGSAKGIQDAVVVLIGDGAGAGIISNGQLYRGSSSSAGEWGHTKISLGGNRCRCGSRGCVETFVGASAVIEAWRGREALEIGNEAGNIRELFDAWRDGDPHAVQAIGDLIEYLGLALSNLVNLYNPQKIVISGWFGDLIAQNLLGEVSRAVRRFSLEQPGAAVLLERSSLGQKAVALGAATLPLDRFIETGWTR